MLMPNYYRNKDYLSIKKLVDFSFFLSIGIVLSIFETFIPISFILPGIKLGITNIVLLMLLDRFNFKDLLLFQLLKITITTLILGVFSTFMFSICGGMLALVLMVGSKKIFSTHITIYTTSMLGAIGHNVGQVLFAMYFLNAYELIFYIPILVIIGCLTGFILAFIVEKLMIQLKGVITDDKYRTLFS